MTTPDGDDAMEDFIDKRVRAGAEMLQEWLSLHPQANIGEATEELFQILMGKRFQ